MLGTMGMGFQNCYRRFNKFLEDIYSHPQRTGQLTAGLISPRYSDARLKIAIHEVLFWGAHSEVYAKFSHKLARAATAR
jgi:hypothetical protein